MSDPLNVCTYLYLGLSRFCEVSCWKLGRAGTIESLEALPPTPACFENNRHIPGLTSNMAQPAELTVPVELTMPAEFGADEAKKLIPCILRLHELDRRSLERLGNPHSLARNLMMANTTLTFLFHPNVFTDPKAEAARIFDLLYAEASAQEKEVAFRATFPRYVTTSRHLGTIHPPLPEIPSVFKQFWDGAMERYRDVYNIKLDPNQKKTPGKDGEPHKLKPLIHKMIEMERRRQQEKEKAEAGELPDQSTGNYSTPSALSAMSKSTKEAVKGQPDSKRSATWGAFNKLLHLKKGGRKQKSSDMDGSIDEESFSEENVDSENTSGGKDLKDRSTSIMGAEAGPFSISMTEDHEARISPNTPGVDDDLAQVEHIEYAENKFGTSQDRGLCEPDGFARDQQNGDEGPHQELQRLKLVKDGSLEAVISTDATE
ncbi:hypothetical protein HYFRA_00012447 [Hymenoscyphus fraxineus]|uniref:Uncharacterized protein n=1 Tax=Hymenoscyphus fraxineus TaxID=746836 RepID=A0A9N9LBD3_9HELO|nr:hypothetical protein HYFRA_00012447 [Hymenoscyphus fraxineus]